jgi:hypothetical protein
MEQNSRLIAWAGIGLLAFSLLLAPWFGPSPLLQVINNLYDAYQKTGMQTGTLWLLFEFLSLYLLSGGLIALWYLAARDLVTLPPLLYGLLGALGAAIAVQLLSAGTAWTGPVTAAAGFVSLGISGWQLAGQQAATLLEATRILERLWRAPWQKANADDIPIAIAVCQSNDIWHPQERTWLRQALRATDRIFFYKGGAIILLWDVDLQRARAALEHLVGKRKKRHFGLALHPQDGQDLETLIRHAAYAQAVAERNGVPFQTAGEIQLPAALRAWLDPKNVGITYAAGLFQLQHAWQEVTDGPWQAYGITFQPPALGSVIEEKLKRLLRGSDLVLQITPSLILAILPDTDDAAGERMLIRMQNALDSNVIHKTGSLQITHYPGTSAEDWQDLVRRFWPDGQPR